MTAPTRRLPGGSNLTEARDWLDEHDEQAEVAAA